MIWRPQKNTIAIASKPLIGGGAEFSIQNVIFDLYSNE